MRYPEYNPRPSLTIYLEVSLHPLLVENFPLEFVDLQATHGAHIFTDACYD